MSVGPWGDPGYGLDGYAPDPGMIPDLSPRVKRNRERIHAVSELRQRYDYLVAERLRIQVEIDDVRDKLEELGVLP